MQMYDHAADWLAAAKNLRPVTLADDPMTKLIAFQGSDGTTHGITLADLKSTLPELPGRERMLALLPDGRLLLLNEDAPDPVRLLLNEGAPDLVPKV